MVSSNPSPSYLWIKIVFWLGLTTFAIWGFIEITEEVFESSDIREIDAFFLTTFAQHRVPWLNRVVERILPSAKQEVTPETFSFRLLKDKLRIARRREGQYLLRSNLCGEDATTLWKYYMQFVEV